MPQGKIIADTENLWNYAESVDIIHVNDPEAPVNSVLLRSFFNALSRPYDYPLYLESQFDHGHQFHEVQKALQGRSQSAVRVDSMDNLVLTMALPIRNPQQIYGSVLLSVQGGYIENEILSIQYEIFRIFVLALVLTIFAGIFFSRSLTVPLARLARMADRICLFS